jgi:hypothetical protein
MYTRSFGRVIGHRWASRCGFSGVSFFLHVLIKNKKKKKKMQYRFLGPLPARPRFYGLTGACRVITAALRDAGVKFVRATIVHNNIFDVRATAFVSFFPRAQTTKRKY